MILREILDILDDAVRSFFSKPASLKDWRNTYIAEEFSDLWWRVKESQFPREAEFPLSAFNTNKYDIACEFSGFFKKAEDRMNNYIDYETHDELYGGHYEIYDYDEFWKLASYKWLMLFREYLAKTFPKLEMTFSYGRRGKDCNDRSGYNCFQIKKINKKWFWKQTEALIHCDGFFKWLWDNYHRNNGTISSFPENEERFNELCEKAWSKSTDRKKSCEKLLVIILQYRLFSGEKARSNFSEGLYYRSYNLVNCFNCIKWYEAKGKKRRNTRRPRKSATLD